MTSDLARIEVADLAGVFAARQLGRGIAGQLALESQDQVRVATALSEISRSAVMAGQRAVVAFSAASVRVEQYKLGWMHEPYFATNMEGKPGA